MLSVTHTNTSLITSITVQHSESPLTIDVSEGTWARVLKIHGQPLYQFGPNCETCRFMLWQVGTYPSSLTVQTIKSAFDHPTEWVSEDIIQTLSAIFPNGTYQVLFKRIIPTLLDPTQIREMYADNIVGDVTPYVIRRADITEIVNRYVRKGQPLQRFTLNEIVIPIQSPTSLHEPVIRQYEEQFSHGSRPCGLSVAVMDVHGRGFWYTMDVVHFLLDGHHKMYAAAKRRCPIHLLTFCALDHGWSGLPPITPEDTWRKEGDIEFLVQEGLL